MTKPRIHQAALAFASDGSTLVNVRSFAGETDPAALLRRALADGGTIFIGLRLRAVETREVLARLDDACHEAAGAVLSARERRRKKKAARGKPKSPGGPKGLA